MTQDKKICCLVMICQMTAILSGVAILYLTVIVIIPSKNELQMGISISPIMCSTIMLDNLNLKSNPDGTPVDCEWASCREWCLSKDPSLCLQIFVRPRMRGANVTLDECELSPIINKECSALNISNARRFRCKKGECKNLDGLYNCTRDELNSCSYLTPAYSCHPKNISSEPILCDDEKCQQPLEGVVSCTMGECVELYDIKNYNDTSKCTRKCTDLSLEGYNTMIFSTERLYAAKCKGVESSNGTAAMRALSTDRKWLRGDSVFMLFCTYVTPAKSVYFLDDCFNGTIGDPKELRDISDYVELQDYHIERPKYDVDWLIAPEEDLQISNDTKLLINSEGCSNTLKKECTRFFKEHTHDERDGRTRHRFPCYFSNLHNDFVTSQFNPDETRLYLILASCVPSGLFILSCGCLYLCSKLVNTDDEGHLQLRSFKKDPIPADASEL